MKIETLLSSLSVLFGIALVYHTGYLLFTVSINAYADEIPNHFYPADQKFDSALGKMAIRAKLSARIYKEDGFEIPVWSRNYCPDTVVQISGIFTEKGKKSNEIDKKGWSNGYGQKHSLKEWEEKTIPKFDTIFAIDTLVTFAKAGNLEDYRLNYHNEFGFHLNDVHQFSKADFSIMPRSTAQYLILLFRTNLKILFYIFLFYQLFKTVRILKSDFSFNEKIFRRVKIIGWILSIYALLMFATSWLIASWYDMININSDSTVPNQISEYFIHMTPRYDFNFEIFSAGLLLIIFSFLMKRSSEIEKNWSLTI